MQSFDTGVDDTTICFHHNLTPDTTRIAPIDFISWHRHQPESHKKGASLLLSRTHVYLGPKKKQDTRMKLKTDKSGHILASE